MLRLNLALLLLLSSSLSFGQAVPDGSGRASEVKLAIETLSAKKGVRVQGVLFDMRSFEGKLLRKDDRTFAVDSKRQGLPDAIMTIKYEQVLEFTGPGISLSYVPDPDTAPYASWDDLKLVSFGDTLEIDRTDGGNIVGVFHHINDSEIVIIDGNKQKLILRDDVKRIFLARREPHSFAKAAKGAGKAGRSVGKAPAPASRTIGSGAGAAAVHAVILAGAAAAGAVNAATRSSPSDRLLLYAK